MTITTAHAASSYGQPVILDDDGNVMDFGPGIKAARKALGLSTTELGEKLGKSRRTVEAWEYGRHAPDTPALLVLAGLLKKSRAKA